MNNDELNERESRDATLDELLGADIDDILNDWTRIEDRAGDMSQEQQDGSVEAVPVENTPKKPERPGWQGTLLTYLHDVAFLLAGLILVFMLLFRVVVVSGTSMNDTLMDGDYLLLLSNTFYQNPSQGDIIVAGKESFDNGAPIIKRVIATEGQTVDINFKTGVVYVDGVALDEPYTRTPTNEEEGMQFPLVVEEGCIFVMGDNRNESKDSRHPEIGLIDRREVLGRVLFLFLPGTNKNEVSRDFGRIGVIG